VFDNNGLVDLESGTIYFTDGFTSSAQFYVATNTAAKLTGGTFHFLPGHLFNGTGNYGVSGDVVLDGPITEPNFLFSSGTLTMTNQITGTVVWQSGRLNGAPTIAGNGVVRYVAGSAQPISGVLTNHGLFLWPTGTYTAIYFSDGRLENMADGVVDLQVDAGFHSDGGGAQFNNAGVIRKSGGTGTGFFNTGVGFLNTGLLDIQSGTMQLPGNSLLPGGRINCGLAGVSDYGHIAFPGAAVLNGALSANLIGGFTPAPGTQFQVVSSGGLGGGFTSLNLPNHFFVTNSNNSVFLVVGDGGPAGFVGSAFAGTNFTCSFQTEAGQSYTVEYNEDLNPTNWEAYYTLPGDGSIVQCLMPMAGTPQCFFRVRQP
jgi:hypothetical protein